MQFFFLPQAQMQTVIEIPFMISLRSTDLIDLDICTNCFPNNTCTENRYKPVSASLLEDSICMPSFRTGIFGILNLKVFHPLHCVDHLIHCVLFFFPTSCVSFMFSYFILKIKLIALLSKEKGTLMIYEYPGALSEGQGCDVCIKSFILKNIVCFACATVR